MTAAAMETAGKLTDIYMCLEGCRKYQIGVLNDTNL